MPAKLKLPARSKYRAKRTEVDGIIFHSKREAHRYCELKMRVMLGEISGLTLQPSYDLIVNGQLICKFIADFRYHDESRGLVVEDCKGMRLPVYTIKKKLMKAIHGIDVKET